MMIKKSNVVTGLDIGSSKISAVAAERGADGQMSILAQITQNSKGISRGAITNLNDAVSSVSGVLTKLREKISKSPGAIYASITGPTVKGAMSTGMIPLSLRGREITKTDMDRCAGVAGTIHLPFDREIVHRVVQRYSVDDKPWIKNPFGLYGSRLACEVYVVTAAVNHIQDIYKCINLSGYDVKGLVFAGIADGAALLDGDSRESNVLLLDIGASLTEACIFSDGVLNDLAVIPVGVEDIKSNINENQMGLELISRIDSKRQEFLKRNEKIDSVILTGAAAFIDNIVEFLEEKLGCKVKVGAAKDIKGDISSIDSVRLTTAIGLKKYAHSLYTAKTLEKMNLPKRISNSVVDLFNNYF